jgi:hypothetical protein
VDGRCSVCAERYPEARPTTLLVVVWGWEHVPVPDSDLDELPGYIAEWTKANPYKFAEYVPGTYGLTPRERMSDPRVVAAKRSNSPVSEVSGAVAAVVAASIRCRYSPGVSLRRRSGPCLAATSSICR